MIFRCSLPSESMVTLYTGPDLALTSSQLLVWRGDLEYDPSFLRPYFSNELSRSSWVNLRLALYPALDRLFRRDNGASFLTYLTQIEWESKAHRGMPCQDRPIPLPRLAPI
jgi:hypothetical protein